MKTTHIGILNLNESFKSVLTGMLERGDLHIAGLMEQVSIHVIIVPNEYSTDFTSAVNDFLISKFPGRITSL